MPASERRTRPAAISASASIGLAGVDPAGLDRRLQAADIDLGVLDAGRVLEAALGHPPIDRHLPAFEVGGLMLLVRALAPLWPLPDVLPRPEPMPRPSRLRLVRAPGLSRSSFSFIGGYSFALDRLD